MFTINNFISNTALSYNIEGVWSIFPQLQIPFWLSISVFLIFVCPNSNEIVARYGKTEFITFRRSVFVSVLVSFVFFVSVIFLTSVDRSAFLYTNF